MFILLKKKIIKIKFEIRQDDSMCHLFLKLIYTFYIVNNLMTKFGLKRSHDFWDLFILQVILFVYRKN